MYLYKNTPAPPNTAWGSSSRVPKPRWFQPLGGTEPPAPTPHSPTGAPGAVPAVGTAAARSVLSLASERTQKCWLSEYPPKVLEVLSLKRFFPQCQVYKCVSYLNNIAHKNHLKICSESRVVGQCFPKENKKLPVHSKF